jgi:hypothetical protein
MANPIWGRGVCACVSMQRQVTHFDERNQPRDETTKPPQKLRDTRISYGSVSMVSDPNDAAMTQSAPDHICGKTFKIGKKMKFAQKHLANRCTDQLGADTVRRSQKLSGDSLR